jgi:hypothetical protein
VAELPYLRYPRWADRPFDLFDMSDGVLLGAGWGPLEYLEGKGSREVAGEAELVVNPLGQERRELGLDVEPSQPGRLEAVDGRGAVVAAADLDGRRRVSLVVPADPARVGLVRLRLAGGTAQPFRVYCSAGRPPRYPPPPSPPRPPADVVGPDDGATLRGNWYPLEVYGGQTFRWVTNDAEIVLAVPPAGGRLLVDLEPGYSLGGPCRLTLRDEAGRALAAASPTAREVISLALPPDIRPGAVVRLHVEASGVPRGVPNDPRILNLRVFRCALARD